MRNMKHVIIQLYNAGFDAWQIQELLKYRNPYYISDMIRDLRRHGFISRLPYNRGKPPNWQRAAPIPKEILMASMIRLKNRTTGEVRLIPQDDERRYRAYGWTNASLSEFREWHMKEAKRRASEECDRKPGTAGA